MFTLDQNASWSTPYLNFGSQGGVAWLEFLQVPGNGKLTARHFMDFNAKKNQLMDAASDAKTIVLGIDPSLVCEASYIVNNLLCAVIMAERSKVSLKPASGDRNVITVYFYGAQGPVAHSPKKPHASHKSKPHGPHRGGRPQIHVF